jgi:4'-phosphopantetheinyl transferase
MDLSSKPCAEPLPCPLGPADVHAWLVRLDETHASRPGVLDAAEAERAARHRYVAGRRRFEQAHVALRLVLACYLNADPASLQFRSDDQGRPALAGRHAGEGLDFSLSRTEDVALIAVSPGRVGADVERVRPRTALADLARSRYSAAELDCLAGGCGGSWLHGFYRHWTAKEAYLKAVGIGVAGLRDVTLDCGPPMTVHWRGTPEPAWVVSAVTVTPAHAAMVVAAGPVTSCRWLEP